MPGDSMHTFTSYFILEFKRFLGLRNKIIIGLLLVLSLGFVQMGINEYRNSLTLKEEFQSFEKLKVSYFVNHRQYGSYGSRVFFAPAPISVFFSNTSVVPEMTAYIDSGERLKIYNPMIGKNIFGIKKFGFTDFSGILLFFGSLLALFYGYDSLYFKEYLKMMASISNRLPLYFSLLASRILMVSLLLLLLIGSALLLMLLNGLPIPLDAKAMNFIVSILLIGIFFLLLGTALGTFKSKLTGIPTLLSCWFILLFIVPAAVNNYIENKSNFIKPLYKFEIEKLKILMGFERENTEAEFKKKYGEVSKENLKTMIISYWNNEFKKLNALEREMLADMRTHLSHLQWVSVLFPTTNYISTVNEISSRGYENLMDFYKYVQEMKAQFVKNFIEKVYLSNFSKVEPAFKGDANVYYAGSRLPGPFIPGILITIVYIILLAWGTYMRFKRIIFNIPVFAGETRQHPDLKLSKGQYRIFSLESNVFLSQLYNLFSAQLNHNKNEKEPEVISIRIFLDEMDITYEKNREPFLYLCSPDSLPGDIRVGDFFEFITRISRYPEEKKNALFTRLKLAFLKNKPFNQLKKQEKAELLLAITYMYTPYIYLIHDIARGMTRHFTVQFKDRMHELSESGKLVLYLTSDTIISEKILEDTTGFIESTSNWIGMVESVRY
jgi:hypothetical protein